MPIMDGWEFLEEYMLLSPELGRTITIYIISSSISPHDIAKAKSISLVTDFIIKPVSKEKLIEIFEKL
jgi:CheY-like chemotaxis protein